MKRKKERKKGLSCAWLTTERREWELFGRRSAAPEAKPENKKERMKEWKTSSPSFDPILCEEWAWHEPCFGLRWEEPITDYVMRWWRWGWWSQSGGKSEKSGTDSVLVAERREIFIHLDLFTFFLSSAAESKEVGCLVGWRVWVHWKVPPNSIKFLLFLSFSLRWNGSRRRVALVMHARQTTVGRALELEEEADKESLRLTVISAVRFSLLPPSVEKKAVIKKNSLNFSPFSSPRRTHKLRKKERKEFPSTAHLPLRSVSSITFFNRHKSNGS